MIDCNLQVNRGYFIILILAVMIPILDVYTIDHRQYFVKHVVTKL